MQEIQYADYEKLIKKLAWNFGKNQDHVEELIAEGNLEFVKARISFCPDKKACFGTYLCTNIKNRFLHLYNKNKISTVDFEDTPSHTPNVERAIFFKDTIETLGGDAREILKAIFETPMDIVGELKYEVELNKCSIKRYFKKLGWRECRIKQSFGKITEALNY